MSLASVGSIRARGVTPTSTLCGDAPRSAHCLMKAVVVRSKGGDGEQWGVLHGADPSTCFRLQRTNQVGQGKLSGGDGGVNWQIPVVPGDSDRMGTAFQEQGRQGMPAES
jgi:hypothetical protein